MKGQGSCRPPEPESLDRAGRTGPNHPNQPQGSGPAGRGAGQDSSASHHGIRSGLHDAVGRSSIATRIDVDESKANKIGVFAVNGTNLTELPATLLPAGAAAGIAVD